MIEEERTRLAHGHCEVIHNDSMMRADVYFAGDDDLVERALGHRVVREVQGEAVQFAPIEYVIVSKLRYFRMGGSDRYLRDVARMMEVSGGEVHRPTLEDWIARLGLGREWTKARAYEGRD